MQEIDADVAPHRASALLAGLGFSNEMQQRPTKVCELSSHFRVSREDGECESRWLRPCSSPLTFFCSMRFFIFSLSSLLPLLLYLLSFFGSLVLYLLLLLLILWFSPQPTNHLDLHSVLWLEEYLQSWDKMLIIVSHDRDFLNAVPTDII